MKKALVCAVLLSIFYTSFYPGVPKGATVSTVNSEKGFMPIERFTIFDTVISFKDGEFYKPMVRSLFKFKSSNIVIIKTSSGILTTSREAKAFCVNKNKFISVLKLEEKDLLLGHDLKSYPIESVVDFHSTGEPITFFILSLSEVFNYFQQDSNGIGFLMHNVHDIIIEAIFNAPQAVPELVKAAPVVTAATVAAISTGVKYCTHHGRVEMRQKNAELKREFDNAGLDPDHPAYVHEEGENLIPIGVDDKGNNVYAVMKDSQSKLSPEAAVKIDLLQKMLKEGAFSEEISDNLNPSESRSRAQKGKTETKPEVKSGVAGKVGKKVADVAEKIVIGETIKTAVKTVYDKTTTTTTTSEETKPDESAVPKQDNVETLEGIAVDPIKEPEIKIDTTQTNPELIHENLLPTRDIPIDLSSAQFPASHVPEPAPAPTPKPTNPTPKASSVPHEPSFGDQFIDISKSIGMGLGAGAVGVCGALGTGAMYLQKVAKDNEELLDQLMRVLNGKA